MLWLGDKLRLIFLILTGSILIIISSFLTEFLYKNGNLAKEQIIIIEHGSSSESISKLLYDNNVISNEVLFTISLKIYSRFNTIKSGEYLFSKQISPRKVLKILNKGKSILRRITIAEGLNNRELLKIVNNNPHLAGPKVKNDFAEGAYMPSTYFFSYGYSKAELVQYMRKNFTKMINYAYDNLQPNSPLKNKQDILTLASIIELEEPNDEDKPRVAAVFINRLRKNMPMQSDPTVAYALTEGKYKLSRPLTKKDLKIASPYNTYYIKGLPLTAIAAPGKASIMAAINPADSNDLYFVVNNKGKHSFAKTYKEHLLNVKKYKEFKKAQNAISTK